MIRKLLVLLLVNVDFDISLIGDILNVVIKLKGATVLEKSFDLVPQDHGIQMFKGKEVRVNAKT